MRVVVLFAAFSLVSLLSLPRSQLFTSAQKSVHPFELDLLDHCLPVNARVCLDDETRRCEPNHLNRSTVVLMAAATESSVFIAWVAQIIISEVLKFPVFVNGDGLGSHNFYEEGSWRLNQPRSFTFDAIMNADNSPDLSCSVEYKKTLEVPADLASEPVCQVRFCLYCCVLLVLVL